MINEPSAVELLKEVDAIYTKYCREHDRVPASYFSNLSISGEPIANTIFIPVPLLKRIHAALHELEPCSECGGTGKIDDADPNGIAFNEIDCEACREA